MSKVTDEQTQLSDRDWWQEAGNHLNLELHGWTFRNNASFIDRETRQYVPLTGAIAARLIALEAASSTPDVEAVAWAHPHGAIWRVDNCPAGIDFSEDGWEPLYAHPNPIKDGVTEPKWQAIQISDDPAERLAYDLAVELEQADLDRKDFVTVNRAKLSAIAKRCLGRLSHNAGEIEAGGGVDELQQSVSALEEERQSLIATKREQIGRLTARAEAAEKRIAELTAALGALDGACDALAASRGQATYLSMIDNDLAAPLLLELDAARSAARAALKESRL